MGINKDSQGSSSSKITSTSLQSEKVKVSPIKAKQTISTIKINKVQRSGKHAALFAKMKQNAMIPLPRLLSRRSSLDAITLESLQAPIEEFPLDSIPATKEEPLDWSFLDDSSVVSLQDPIEEFPLGSIPAETTLLDGSWTATWVE